MKPVVPPLDRCATCGQPVAGTPNCPSCGASLAVDVVSADPVQDPRLAFEAARAVVGLGLPGLDFAVAKAALLTPGRPLASGVDRETARRLLSALAEAGVTGTARAAQPPPAASPTPRRRFGPVALAAAGGAVIALALASAIPWRAGHQGVTPVEAPHPGESSPGPGRPAPIVAAADGSTSSPPPGTPTVAALLRQALPATAVVACQGQSGTGFFVEADRLVTNAHVTCGDQVPLEITLGDGRQLIGKVEKRDAWLDWAVVVVPGAAVARPLTFGDSTSLVAGDPVGLIGAPRGLGSTVHEGKVSFVGRNLRGIAFLQLNAAVNPGNSGGPLLDAQGRVVGIVSLKVNETDGLGMALPVEYLRAALPGQPGPDEAARLRWSAIGARAEAEDAEEVARLRKDLARPVLAAVASSGARSIELTVMQRWSSRASASVLTVEVQRDGQVLCRPSGRVEAWIDLAAKVKKDAEPPSDSRTAWLLRNDLLAGVHGGSADVDLARCPDPLPDGARLRLEGAEGERSWFRVPGPEPVTDHERELWRAREAAEARRRLEVEGRRATEEAWRKAFKSAREQVAESERKCEGHRKELQPSNATWAQGQARQKLPEEEQRLRVAREQLEELDRLASQKGVPREWR